MIQITDTLAIEEKSVNFSYIKASGPGGQNVNKVATAVQLRFDVGNDGSLPEDVRERLMHLAGKRLTEDGILIINARRFRTQASNRRDAMNRLIQMIQAAVPAPKKRRKRRPSTAARHRRLQEKRQRGEKKESRQFNPFAEME